MLLLLLASPAAAANLKVYVFDGDQGGPRAGVPVRAGDAERTSNRDGLAAFDLPAGEHTVTVDGGRTPVRVHEGEVSEVIVTIAAGRPPAFLVDQPDAATAEAAAAEPTTETQTTETPLVDLLGTLASAETGKPVARARIYVRGRPESAASDREGRFLLRLPAGPQVLSVIHPDFSTATHDVELSGTSTSVRFDLLPAAVQLEDTVVYTPYIEGGVAGVVAERRETAQVVDVLSAEQMSRAGDGDAASALERVTGLTVVGGRYVYVRGMGERYSATLLNGAGVPSPEPERRVVPLDLFPTGILSSVVVRKTYSPDLPGEFGGGVVELRTRSLPEESFLDVSASTGYRPGTTFEDGLTYHGGDLDFLGIDDGTRALPGAVRAASNQQILLERTRLSDKGFTAAELERLGESMPNHWNTARRTVPPPLGLGISGGHVLRLGDVKVGGVASGHYDQDWDLSTYRQTYYLVGAGGALEKQHAYDFESLERRIELGGVLEAGAEIGKAHRIGLTTLLLRITDDETRVFSGRNRDAATTIEVTRLRWIEQMLLSQQVRGEHDLGAADLHLDWRYAFSRATRDEPDRRTYRYDHEPQKQQPGTDLRLLSDRPEGNQRLYSELVDDTHDAALALRWPFGDGSSLGAGAQVVLRDRGVDTRRFKFQDKGPRAGDPAIKSQRPEDIFVPENIGNDAFQFQETTRQTDNYSAAQQVYGGYLQTDLRLPWNLRLAGGLRVEHSDQQVETFELFNPDQAPVVASLVHTDLLPAAGLTWSFVESMQLRAAFGQTVARPDFRELSPATFNDVTGGRQVFGNPDLDRAVIRHYDVRWEWYPSPRDSVSVALFYKDFERPIETIIIPSAQFSVTYANAEAATNMGAEIEGRTSLGFIHPATTDLYLAGNLSLIRSRVTLADDGIQTSKERPLEGQSPYVVNLQLGWEDLDTGFNASLLYNLSGPRIVEVGAQGAPDILEEPRHQLDAVVSTKLGAGFSLKLKAENLIDQPARRTQGGRETYEEVLGRKFGIGLSYEVF